VLLAESLLDLTLLGLKLKPPQPISRIADSLARHPNFIKTGFHIGRFITTPVNIEAEHADIQALRCDLDSASLRINVRISLAILFYRLLPSLTPFHI
jgi:hypothetical protein